MIFNGELQMMVCVCLCVCVCVCVRERERERRGEQTNGRTETESQPFSSSSFSFADDGICVACKMPTNYVTIVENYCLADFGKVSLVPQVSCPWRLAVTHLSTAWCPCLPFMGCQPHTTATSRMSRSIC